MDQREPQPIKLISVSDLKDRVDGAADSWLVDVRTVEEYRHLHATSVKCVIPHTEVGTSLERLPADKGTPIYLICRTGNRSGKVARLLTDLGFSAVYNVSGGMMAWMELGFPTESGPGVLERS
jgi:rhodanese-related sulfurtransferase